MDPELRHDLEENDLLAFLTNFRQWWARNGTWVMAVVAVALLIWAGRRYWNYRQYSLREEHWGELDQLSNPQAAALLADESATPAFKALAYLRAGDLLLAKLVEERSSDEQARRELADQATAMYRRVLEVPGAPVLMQINAQLGLASLAEERGDWPSAEDLYQRVQEQARDLYPAIAKLAASRQQLLPRLRVAVAFAPEPAPPAASIPPTLEGPGPTMIPSLDLSPSLTSPGAFQPLPSTSDQLPAQDAPARPSDSSPPESSSAPAGPPASR